MKDIKSKAWTILLYPDSMPDNWIEMLEELALPVAVSPLHDKDVLSDGTPKKPHYHLMFVWEGPTTFKNAQRIADMFNGPIPKKVESIQAMYDYFVHKNHPNKYQYNDADRMDLNGFCIDYFDSIRTDERQKIMDEVENVIFEHSFCEIFSLIKYFDSLGMRKHKYIVRTHTTYFNALITSFRYNREDELKEKEEYILRVYHEYEKTGVVHNDTLQKITDLFGSVKIVD